jgi:hypothetical protein
MAFIPKELSGSLFKNDKGENALRPDYRGDCMVDGVMYEMAAWIKPLASDASKRFMSISFKPKEAQQAPQRPAQRPAPSHDAAKARQLAPQRPASRFDDMDDDIPF